MDKTLNLFSRIYKPVYRNIESVLTTVNSSEKYFTMMNDMMKAERKEGDAMKKSTPIPYIVAQKIAREADFQNSFQYVHRLVDEKKRISAMAGGWANMPI